MTLIINLILIATIGIPIILIFEYGMRGLRKLIATNGEERIGRTIVNIFRFIFYIVASIIVLGLFGINITGLLAGAGFFGIVLGLAVQATLSNFFNGMYIIITRIVRVNDEISINAIGSNIQVTGKVKHIGWSHLEFYENETKDLKFIPNSLVVSSILTRHSREK